MTEFYEPDDDSYLLADCLDKEAQWLRAKDPILCAEVGCGSGFVIDHLMQLFGPCQRRIFCATDINRFAIEATRSKITTRSKEPILLAKTKFLEGFKGPFDLIVFNPPYVETEMEELVESTNDSIVKAYAGGPKGVVVIKEFLDLIPVSSISIWYPLNLMFR